MSVSPGAVISRYRSQIRSVIWITLALLVCFSIASDLLPMRLRDDLYAGDAAQHTWWMYRFADPELFPNDLIAKYYSLLIYSPPAYQAIFKLTAGWCDPQRLSETIAIVLALISAALSAAIGRRLGSLFGASMAVLAYVLFGFSHLHEGGFPRSFGFPLLLAGMLAMISRKWILLGVIFIACTLLYPPAVLNLAPMAAIVFIASVIRRFWLRWTYEHAEMASPVSLATMPMMAFVVLTIGAIGIVATLYLRPLPADIGTFYNYRETRQMPEWGKDGRSAFYRGSKVFYYHGATSGIGLRREYLLVSLAALVITIAVFHRAIPIEAWLLLASAVGMWALAHLLMFKLYLPSRYTTYAIPVFAICWAAGLSRGIRGVLSRFITLRPIVLILVCSIIVICFGVYSIQKTIVAYHAELPWSPPVGYNAALAAIESLPKNTLLASHPVDANTIPLRAHRSVLTNAETSIAYNRIYYSEMQRRLQASFEMLYAIDWRVVDALADQYGVSVFVVNRDRLSQPDQDPYFEPFRTTNVPLIEQGKQIGFVMADVPADRVLFHERDVTLVRVGTSRTK